MTDYRRVYAGVDKDSMAQPLTKSSTRSLRDGASCGGSISGLGCQRCITWRISRRRQFVSVVCGLGCCTSVQKFRMQVASSVGESDVCSRKCAFERPLRDHVTAATIRLAVLSYLDEVEIETVEAR